MEGSVNYQSPENNIDNDKIIEGYDVHERSSSTSFGHRRGSTRSSLSARIHVPISKIQNGTILNTSINSVCNVIGGSILSLPLAVYNGSVVMALILLIICTFISGFAVYALVLGCDIVQKFSYTEVLAFTMFPDEPLEKNAPHSEDSEEDEGIYEPGKETPAHKKRRYMAMFMEISIFFNNFGSLIIYSRIIADAIPAVLVQFIGASGIWVQRWFWVLIPAIIFFILGCARNMHELKWTSLIGFGTIFYVVIMIIVRYFTNLYEPITTEKGVDEIDWFKIKILIFSTISQYSLAIGYQYNVPYFYRELIDRRPSVMMKTVYIAFPVITACYATTGILGYLTFGALVNAPYASGNIMNNFSKFDIPINIGRLGLFFHFACVYPIMQICARRGLHRFICLLFEGSPLNSYEPEKGLVDENNNPLIYPPGDPATTTMRSIVLEAFFIVCVGSLIGSTVPGIGIVIEVTGCMFGVPLMLILPGAIALRIFKPGIAATAHLPLKFFRIISWTTVVSGIFFFVCGFVSLIYGILYP